MQWNFPSNQFTLSTLCMDINKKVFFQYTVELVYSGHPSDAAKWLLYTGGLLIEVFSVYVVHGKFRWDFPTDRLMQGDRPSQVTVTGSTVFAIFITAMFYRIAHNFHRLALSKFLDNNFCRSRIPLASIRYLKISRA